MMDTAPFQADSVYAMDRAYLDFERLYRINQLSAFFVIKSKSNTRLRRIYSAPVDKTDGVQADQTVMLVGYKSRQAYPDPFRRVRYHDAKRDKRIVVLTNNFLIPDGCKYLSLALAGGAVLQVDQTASANQIEGVVEGAVAGGATKNIWVGLAVALEEIGQEVLAWGADHISLICTMPPSRSREN